MNEIVDRKLARLQLWSIVVGLVSAVPCAVAMFSESEPFQRIIAGFPTSFQQSIDARFDLAALMPSYLLALLFWWGIATGALGLHMITYLVASRWGRAGRVYFAACTWTLPLLAALFVPIALRLDLLYVWASPDAAEKLHLGNKAAYLNPEAFHWRALGYFGFWIVAAIALSLFGGRNQNSENGENSAGGWRRGLSSLGLVLLVLTTTFAAFDWAMSLQPQWYSTIYGALIGAGGMLTAMAVTVVMYALTMPKPPSSQTTNHAPAEENNETPEQQILADLGSLLLALVMIWAYFAFSQYLIIWSANLPVETSWYLLRLQGGWQWAALAMVVLHFFVPFLLLLSRETKTSPRRMTFVALLLLAVHLLALHWHVAPVFYPERITLVWSDIVAPLAVGGFWMFVFTFSLRSSLARVTT